MQIASQLEPYFNEVLADAYGLSVLPIARGVPHDLPPEVTVLVAATMDQAAPSPPGRPFGLQWIQLLTSGTDKHPPWLLKTVPTSTTRGVAAEQISEYAISAILYQVKQMNQLWIHDAAQWRSISLGSIAGSTVGIVGMGALGATLARKLLALGAKVLVTRGQAPASPVEGVDIVSGVGALLAESDHLVLAAPATASTWQLINWDTLTGAKPGLHIVNVSRGELIDDEALLRALDQGIVSAASLDVTAPEPLPSGHPFYSHSKSDSVHTPLRSAKFHDFPWPEKRLKTTRAGRRVLNYWIQPFPTPSSHAIRFLASVFCVTLIQSIAVDSHDSFSRSPSTPEKRCLDWRGNRCANQGMVQGRNAATHCVAGRWHGRFCVASDA